jgi:hypothetical protein
VLVGIAEHLRRPAAGRNAVARVYRAS